MKRAEKRVAFSSFFSRRYINNLGWIVFLTANLGLIMVWRKRIGAHEKHHSIGTFQQGARIL